MIDFHSHILPGMDDGCATTEEALQAARALVEQGIQTLVASSHYLPGHYELTPDMLLSATRDLQQTLDDAGIVIRLIPGCEIMVHQGMTERLLKGDLLTIADQHTYALVEFPLHEIPWFSMSVLEHMVESGITPIVAHPARYYLLHRDTEEIRSWYCKGILAQLDIASLFGLHGSDVQRFAELLIRNHLVHLLGSDLHGPSSRVRLWKDAVKKVVKLGGEEYFHVISETLPRMILRGEDIRLLVPSPRRIKTFSIRRIANAILGNDTVD